MRHRDHSRAASGPQVRFYSAALKLQPADAVLYKCAAGQLLACARACGRAR